MTWNLFEKPKFMTRRQVVSLNERPQEITPGRWRAMQLQLEQEQQEVFVVNNNDYGEFVVVLDR